MIPLHKYSYPYLGQLEFNNWMGMIWKETHVLIKGPTADNTYQTKKQALGPK